MTGKIVTILCAAALLTSCGEYNKALKSTDYNYKFEFAKRAFEYGSKKPRRSCGGW